MARKHLRRSSSSARRQDGYLCDISVDRLLTLCRSQRASGSLRIDSWGVSARIGLHGGEVRDVTCGSLRDQAALDEIGRLRDGSFTLRTETVVDLRPAPRGHQIARPEHAIGDTRAARGDTRAARRHDATMELSSSMLQLVAEMPPAPAYASPTARVPSAMTQMTQAAMTKASTVASAWHHQGHPAQPQPAWAYAGHANRPAHAGHAGDLMPRLRLPSTAVSLGILCLTVLFSMVAIQF